MSNDEQFGLDEEAKQKLLEAIFGQSATTQRVPIEHSNIDNLTDEDLATWNRLIDGINALVNEVFPDRGTEGGDTPVFVFGAQFGQMGRDDQPEQPVALVTSNLSVCAQIFAVEDMLDIANALHREHHDRFSAKSMEDFVGETVPAGSVPADIREEAESYAKSLGLGPEQVVFVEYADVSDLRAEPEIERD